MNSSNGSPACASKAETYVHRQSQPWLRLPVWLVVGVVMVTLSALPALADSSTPGGTVPGGTVPQPEVIYLGFKHSDEIELDNDQADFIYKNEDIVAFTPATGQFSIFFDGSECGLTDANLDDFDILANGHILFTLRSKFTIPSLGKVDDSDVIEYTPDPAGCGTFAFYLIGADVGLTKGQEDIDALGIDEDGSLIVSTIGTAKVPSHTGELEVKDQDLIKLDKASGTWSLYFDGSDVGLTHSSEDIRSVWLDAFNQAQGIQNIYLTLSGDFAVESNNKAEGDKNDVEGCSLLHSGETTECFFHKLLDGEAVGAENQLDGLAVKFGSASTPVSAVGLSVVASSEELAVEAANDASDLAEAVTEDASGVTNDDFIDVVSRVYLPYVQR